MNVAKHVARSSLLIEHLSPTNSRVSYSSLHGDKLSIGDGGGGGEADGGGDATDGGDGDADGEIAAGARRFRLTLGTQVAW